MKRMVILIGLFFAFAKSGWAQQKTDKVKEPILSQLGATVVVIHDKASLGLRGAGLAPVVTVPTPVVFERTNQVLPAGYIIIWIPDQRADLDLSNSLHEATLNYKFAEHVEQQIGLAFMNSPVALVKNDQVKATLTRAKILHPVSLADPTMLSRNRNYPQWEAAVIKDLKDQSMAVSLMEVNVFLWGIWMGGAKVEKQDGEKKGERLTEGNNLGAVYSRKGAQAFLGIKTKIVRIKDGETLFEDEHTYTTERKTDKSTEDFMANEASLLQEKMDCLIEWYAKDLRNKLAGEPLLDNYECPERQKL